MPIPRRSTRSLAVVAPLLVLAATLVGCRPDADEPAAGDRDPLARFHDQELAWEPCEESEGVECATLTVPLDHTEPEGETIEIAVLRVRATDPDARVGHLVMNPGGPGVSGVEVARAGAELIGDELAAAYDLVGFDPRGVGRSTAVSCGDGADLDAFLTRDPDPRTPSERERADAEIAAFAETCRADSGSLIEHVSTVEAARDMDVLRAALGEERLHFLGFSYGTVLGATYAELFTDRVGRMVLDGAVDPSLDGAAASEAQLVGFQRAFEAYVADCLPRARCPLGDDLDAAERAITALLAGLQDEPLPTDLARDLTEHHAVYGLLQPLYDPEQWDDLTLGLEDALLHGDGSVLLELADDYTGRDEDGTYDSNLHEVFHGIGCLDGTAGPAGDLAAVSDRLGRISPALGPTFAHAAAFCDAWPITAEHPVPAIRAEGAPTIVVVGTTRDPASPYEGAVALAEQLASGALVTRDGDGHLGFRVGNDCVDRAVTDFYLDGTEPEPGLEC